MSDKGQTELQRLSEAVNLLKQEAGDKVPVSQFQAFLECALAEGQTITEIGIASGIKGGSRYPTVMSLADGNQRAKTPRGEGRGLLKLHQNNKDFRKKKVMLTRRGSRLRDSLMMTLSDERPQIFRAHDDV